MAVKFTDELVEKVSDKLDIVKNGETYYVAKKDVVEFGTLAIEDGAAVLGFEGFLYSESQLVPQMDAIASFEPGTKSLESFKKVAEQTIESSSANYYEFVFDLD